ncbi:nucleotide synthetase [Phenylobacterium sp.]|uniref:nucleotide synthetase n=1 Tax=Phenylobacterium sp. TaxID=1871053 RepID=UPI002725C23F|nr:nucleotide synthetase [Phenylobacterium sp.]MDO8377998.1 hypothetical protein [Phenylobacterium sp.]
MITMSMGENKLINHMIKLQTNPPPNFKAMEVVYARYTLAAMGKKLRFWAEQSGVFQGGTLDDLLAQRCGPTPTDVVTVPKVANGGGAGGRPITDRDVLVDMPCFLVMELSPDWDWQFRTQDVGVTSKEDYNDDNCDLWHINPDGARSRRTPNGNDCRLVVFSAVRRQAQERQKFNLHIEVVQSPNDSVEIIIDPDVPNNGGTFEP